MSPLPLSSSCPAEPEGSGHADGGAHDVTINYSRPGVKVGRSGAIWSLRQCGDGRERGDVITFSTDVKVNGQPLAAGTYSLHTIPTKGDWTVIFNKKPTVGSYSYDEKEDALRSRSRRSRTSSRVDGVQPPGHRVDKATVALDWRSSASRLRSSGNGRARARERPRRHGVAAADDHQTAFRCAGFAFQTTSLPMKPGSGRQVDLHQGDLLNLRLKATCWRRTARRGSHPFGEKAIAVGGAPRRGRQDREAGRGVEES